MIGFILRAALGGESAGCCALLLGGCLAFGAICGLAHCCKCRLRDCRCCKRCLRAMGTDPFDDFEMMVLVHQVSFTSSSKYATSIQVRAGEYIVETDACKDGRMQQALTIFVEQGTEKLYFELLNSSKKVLAVLEMDVVKEILPHSDEKNPIREKAFNMKAKKKDILNPRVTLTFSPDGAGDEEQALLSGLGASGETTWMLTQHLRETKEELAQAQGTGKDSKSAKAEPISELMLLAKGCEGPLEQFGSWGSKISVYVAINGPPATKKYVLQIWKAKGEFEKGAPCQEEVELLRMTSVMADPGKPDVFMVHYVDHSKVPQKLTFQRVDRSRDVWVEMLQLLVTRVHQEREEKKHKGKK